MTDAIVTRLYDVLVEALRHRSGSGTRSGPLTIGELYEELAPYRAVRSRIDVELLGDYEHALLRLLAGERGLLRVEPIHARAAIRREADSDYPTVGLFRKYAAASVAVDSAALETASPVPLAEEADETPEKLPAPEESPAPGEPPALGELAASEALLAPDGPAAPVQPPAREEAPGPEGLAAPEQRPESTGGDVEHGLPGSPGPRAERGAPTSLSSCRFCGRELPPDRAVRFCPFCGGDQRLLPCPGCGAVVESGWRYCVGCGRELESD